MRTERGLRGARVATSAAGMKVALIAVCELASPPDALVVKKQVSG
jgi:hypothetical protein